jgi:hypothetical protein
MERGAAVRAWGFAILAALLAGSGATFAADRQVVLVVSADSPLQQLEPLEVQKLFLGLPVTRDGHLLRPFRNVSDAALTDVFLQYVVAMSQSAYDRRILTQVLQRGRPRPLEIDRNSDVVKELAGDRYAVSYMWLREVPPAPRLRIIRVLWTE